MEAIQNFVDCDSSRKKKTQTSLLYDQEKNRWPEKVKQKRNFSLTD